jgi:arylsulfatase A-like enzyme
VATPVSILDVPPTILDLAGLPPREEFAGRSLAGMARGEGGEEVLLFAEVDRSEVSKSATLRDGRYKYMRHFVQDWERLFDLETDPEEKRDLAASKPELLAALRERIREAYEELEKRGGEAPTRALDEDEVDRLRALGYVDD